jgi:hypothetical protein
MTAEQALTRPSSASERVSRWPSRVSRWPAARRPRVHRAAQEDAADVNGLLVTATQLGPLLGTTPFGTLFFFLNWLDMPGAYASGHTLLVCTTARPPRFWAAQQALFARRCPSCGAMAESDRRRGRRPETGGESAMPASMLVRTHALVSGLRICSVRTACTASTARCHSWS